MFTAVMGRILILGGTGWLGRSITRAAIAAGHDVTCLARGASGPAAPGARLIVADRRSPRAYDGAHGDWDDVVELSWEPGLVGSALDALAVRSAHWTLLSSVSVYARNDRPDADEEAELVDPADLSAYPDAKVHAERLSMASRRGDVLLARAGLIVGPGDPSDRFGYWPARMSRGGRIVVPETTDRWVQAIDVDDLAAWIVRAGSAGTIGPVNAVGEPTPLALFFDQVRDATGGDAEVVTLDDDTLRARGVQHWSGPRSLPLWLPRGEQGFVRRDDRRFTASDGRRRSLRETIARTLADEIARGVARPRRAGLSPAEEREVLGD